MFKHLLVPLDGSELAEIALPMAKVLALRFESEITLLRAIHLPPYIGNGFDFTEVYANLSQNMQEEATAYLEAKLKGLLAAGFKANSHIVVGEPAADAILLAADELAVDTIVMSTHGRSGVMRWVFGSVADKVLQQANIPILLARLPLEKSMPHQTAAIESVEGVS
jgi:nucleotide-binding universal stress UspA family protein